MSMRRMRPQRSAHATDMMVDWAPLSTKALMGTPFTSASTYSMITRPKDCHDNMSPTRQSKHTGMTTFSGRAQTS